MSGGRREKKLEGMERTNTHTKLIVVHATHTHSPRLNSKQKSPELVSENESNFFLFS